MIDLLSDIVKFITYDVWLSEKDFMEKGNKGIKRIERFIKKRDLGFKLGLNPHELRKFRKDLNKLKEIRTIYLKGKPYLQNRTKGFEKFTSYKITFDLIKEELKRGNVEEATKSALNHLNYIKNWRSERTYYRHKKKIKGLGIEI